MNTLLSISGVSCYEKNGTAYLRLEDVARGLGFTQSKNGSEYIRWETINKYLEDIGFPNKLGKNDYIPENIFYRLAMKAKNETAEKFQALVADEIIPSIRKTGTYTTKPVCIEDVLIQSLQEMKEMRKKVEQTSQRLDSICDVIALNPNSWREDARNLISKTAYKIGGFDYIKDLQSEIYRLVDERAAVNLSVRLTNKRNRLAAEGVCKSKRDKITKLDVIADDKKLIEIYIAVVKELAVKNGVGGVGKE